MSARRELPPHLADESLGAFVFISWLVSLPIAFAVVSLAGLADDCVANHLVSATIIFSLFAIIPVMAIRSTGVRLPDILPHLRFRHYLSRLRASLASILRKSRAARKLPGAKARYRDDEDEDDLE